MRPITPYIIAVCLEHVYPSLLSISKTAAYEPEGSIFGFLMSFVALSGLLMIFFLENEGSFKLDLRLFTKVQRLNKVSVPFGCSCIVGLLVVLNFRSRAVSIHLRFDFLLSLSHQHVYAQHWQT